MEDVKRVAHERAAKAQSSPVGASFESERKRTKRALIKQIDSLDGRNVRMIAAAGDTPEEDTVLCG